MNTRPAGSLGRKCHTCRDVATPAPPCRKRGPGGTAAHRAPLQPRGSALGPAGWTLAHATGPKQAVDAAARTHTQLDRV